MLKPKPGTAGKRQAMEDTKAITFEEFERRLQRWRMSVRSPDDLHALPALIEDLVDSYVDEHNWLRHAIDVLTSWPFKLSNREIADILQRAVSQRNGCS
jgi:hypothetical protein